MFAASGCGVVYQAVAVLICGAFFLSVQGPAAAGAAAFGGLVALANAVLLSWRMRSSAQSSSDAARELRSLYRFSMERFAVAGLLLAFGLGILHLVALPLLAGFVFGQVTTTVSYFLRAFF